MYLKLFNYLNWSASVVPSGPPQNIEMLSRTSTSVFLSWDSPLELDINDRDGVTAYSIRVDESGSYVNISNVNEYNVSGLLPDTSYTIFILAENEQGLAPNFEGYYGTIDVRTGIASKLYPPQHILYTYIF